MAAASAAAAAGMVAASAGFLPQVATAAPPMAAAAVAGNPLLQTGIPAAAPGPPILAGNPLMFGAAARPQFSQPQMMMRPANYAGKDNSLFSCLSSNIETEVGLSLRAFIFNTFCFKIGSSTIELIFQNGRIPLI